MTRHRKADAPPPVASAGAYERTPQPRTDEAWAPALSANHADDRDLLASYRGMVRRFVGSRVSDPFEAEDVTQQTIHQAMQKMDTFLGGNLRAWMFCIARHVIANRRRDAARVDVMEFDEREHPSGGGMVSAPDGIQAAYDARDRIQCCLDCLATRLRPAEEVAVLLADVHGFSDKEAAAQLKMNLPSFKFLLHRARGRLHAVAAFEQWDNSCPLVRKTGVARACAGGAGSGEQTERARANHTGPSGLDEAALATLRDELVTVLQAR